MKGLYVLIIDVAERICPKVGALGPLYFDKGSYAYVGSAQSNIELRVKRHLKKDKVLFWHIDYLLANLSTRVVAVFFKAGAKEEECRIADMILNNGCEPVAGFGCSDCNCTSHLFRAANFDFLQLRLQVIKV